MVVNVNESVILNVVDMNPTIQIQEEIISLNILSGGLVPTGGASITLTAGTNLSALRAITTDGSGNAIYASNASASLAVVVGISTTATSTGGQVTIATDGIITDAGWNWTKGPVFLGTNGLLTQTVPSGGAVIVHIGRAIAPTQIIIDVDITIQTV